MGMVAPFAIRLAIRDVETAGAVAGRLYAVSTIGSLLGTFLSALVLIPLIGTQRTLLSARRCSARAERSCSAVAGCARRRSRRAARCPARRRQGPSGLIFEDESLYQFIQVAEQDGARRLYLDEGLAMHSVWRQDEVLTGGVWDTFLAVVDLLGRPPERVAMLGNAGGTAARAMGASTRRPRSTASSSTLPSATPAGATSGWATIGTLTVHDADARPFLRRSGRAYDLIIVDAYRPPYVPFYLATQEFFELVRERLAPGGIVALNVATVPDNHDLADEHRGTLATVLRERSRGRRCASTRSSSARTASRRGVCVRRRPRSTSPRGRPARGPAGPFTPSDDPWTDDRAPVEWITDRMIVEFAAAGRTARRGSAANRS